MVVMWKINSFYLLSGSPTLGQSSYFLHLFFPPWTQVSQLNGTKLIFLWDASVRDKGIRQQTMKAMWEIPVYLLETAFGIFQPWGVR